LLAAFPGAARAATASLSVSNPQPLAGTLVTFTVNVNATGAPAPVTGSLNFGDGSAPVPVGPVFPVRVGHVYTTPGVYTAVFTSTATRPVFLTIFVTAPTPRVPHGQILSTLPLVSPVLAGDGTNIQITYRIETPTGAVYTPPAQLVVVIDLLDAHGRLVARGDPVALPPVVGELAVTNLSAAFATANIPFTVPSDARGVYRVRAYIRTADVGGTVAVGQSAPLVVVGGPDPQPAISASIHATGSLEAGPSFTVGGGAGTIPSSAANANLNANLALAFQNLTYTLTAASTINPTSRRIDPLLTLVPGAPELTSPNEQQPPQASPGPNPGSSSTPHYQDSLGPVTASLPSLLFSGGESLRGLDAVVNPSGWRYEAAAGYPQLAGPVFGAQDGYLVNVARMFSAAQSLHLTFLQNIDDPYTFVPGGATHPLDARAGGVEFDETFAQHVTLALGAAESGASPELTGGPTTKDAAEKAQLGYSNGATSLSFEYHNFGPNFATGNGVGATSDSVGGSGQATLGLTRSATLALTYAHEEKRSSPFSDAQQGAILTLAPPGGLNLSLSETGDRSASATSKTSTHSYSFSAATPGTSGSFALTASLATLRDALQPADAGVTRTGTLQYTWSRGAGSFNIGLNGTQNQGNTTSSTLGESVVLSLPIGTGRAGQSPNPPANAFAAAHGFELSLSAANLNQNAVSAKTRDLYLGGMLSYHLGPHVSLGLHAQANRHTDFFTPHNNGTSSVLRARLDVNI
jgi:hypothetical protein